VSVPSARVALSTASVYPEPTGVGFALAAAMGYDAVEVMVALDETSQDIDAVRSLREPEVEEAGTGDLDLVDALDGPQPGRQQLGDLPRRTPSLLGQLQRDARRVVAVRRNARALDGDPRGRLDGQLTGLDRRYDGAADGSTERGGSHLPRVVARPT
jgi:hypothetical protein